MIHGHSQSRKMDQTADAQRTGLPGKGTASGFVESMWVTKSASGNLWECTVFLFLGLPLLTHPKETG